MSLQGMCWLMCYVCGKRIGTDPYLMRAAGEGSVNSLGFGAIEACHQECALDAEGAMLPTPDPEASPRDGGLS